MIENIMASMKADSIPSGFSGLWYIVKIHMKELTEQFRHGKFVALPAGQYTHLFRITDSTLYSDPPGTVVMEDTPFELRTHLDFVLKAHGNVLVTGLGLGCVLRGLQQNPRVDHITCIENSKDVLSLVSPYMPLDRLTIIEADALEWSARNTQKFDCAWHDLWTDRDQGEPHLDLWHARLLMSLRKNISRQGAWAFDRQVRRRLTNRGLRWIG